MSSQITTMTIAVRELVVDALRVRMSTSWAGRTPRVERPTSARRDRAGNSHLAELVVRLDVLVDVSSDAPRGEQRRELGLRDLVVLVDVTTDELDLQRSVRPADRPHTRRVHRSSPH